MAQTMIRETVVYTIDELKEHDSRAYQKAIEKLSEMEGADFEYHSEYVIEDAKAIGALFGIDIRNVYYSGFWSQGDGAQFVGTYSYEKGGVKAVTKYVGGTDAEVIRIARELQGIQKEHFYQLRADVTSSGRYSHEYATDIEVTDDRDTWETTYTVSRDTEDTVKDLLRDFMRWIYRRLEAEYDYRTSEEYVVEDARETEMVFDGEGRIYYP